MNKTRLQQLAGILTEATGSSKLVEGAYPIELEKVVQVKAIDLSPDDWQLYDSRAVGKRAAATLNKTFQRLINDPRVSRVVAKQRMQQTMTKFADVGADDSEPHQVLNQLFRMIDSA